MVTLIIGGTPHKTSKHVAQGPERKDITRFSSRIYPSKRFVELTWVCLPHSSQLKGQFQKYYIFNKLTLFNLCEKLRRDLKEEWASQFFSSRILCLALNCSLPLPIPCLLPSLHPVKHNPVHSLA